MHFSIGSSILKSLKVPVGPDIFPFLSKTGFPICFEIYRIGFDSGSELRSPINITEVFDSSVVIWLMESIINRTDSILATLPI